MPFRVLYGPELLALVIAGLFEELEDAATSS